MRFAFIQAHARIWHVVTMCEVLEVSRAGYYAWRARPLCERVKDDRVLTEKIRTIQQAVKFRYGSPRVHQELRAQGAECGLHKVERLMHEHELAAQPAPRFIPATTASAHGEPVAPNVVNQQFALASHPTPNGTWAGDITYIGTREGWLYLAVLLDLASRCVVGWALRTSLHQELTLAALDMALRRRGAYGGCHHSDRGAQYASGAYQERLATAGWTTSMSRRGNCWDNAVVESFFATLTKELLGDHVYETRAEASRAVFEFIEIWYNRQRRHSTLGYLTPVEFEEQLLKAG
jgi:transposase InsO family protein